MSSERAVLSLVLFVSVASLVPLWIIPYPPMEDFPKHLLIAKVIRQLHDPIYPYSRYFLLDPFPIPNMIFEIFLVPLSYIFSYLAAGKIVLSVAVLLLPAGVLCFLRAIDTEKTANVLFCYPFLYSYYLNMGFVNFCIALGLSFATLGYWWKSRQDVTLKKGMVIGFLLILLYVSHGFVHAATIFLLCMFILFTDRRAREVWRHVGFMAPSLILVGIHYLRNYLIAGVHYPLGYTSLPDVAEQLAVSFISFSRMELLVLSLPLFWMAVLILKTMVSRGMIEFTRDRVGLDCRSNEGKVFFVMLSVLVLVFMLPSYGFGCWPVNTRLNLFIVFLGLAVFELPKNTFWKSASIGMAVGCSLTLFAYNGMWYLQINAQYKDYISGVDVIEPNKKILPVVVDRSGGSVRAEPFLGFYDYYYVMKGGVGPYFFAKKNVYPIFYREEAKDSLKAPILHPRSNEEGLRLEEAAGLYDYIVVWGKDENIEASLEGMFRPIHKKGKLTVYANKKGVEKGKRRNSSVVLMQQGKIRHRTIGSGTV